MVEVRALIAMAESDSMSGRADPALWTTSRVVAPLDFMANKIDSLDRASKAE